MKKTIMNAILFALAMGFCSVTLADNDRMDLDMPDIPSEVKQTMSANLRDGARLDDGKMNAQLLEEEFEIAEAYIDQELLSDLDLDEIGSFEGTDNSAILDDK